MSGGSGLTCPNCGAPVAADAHFCANCGTALATGATAAEERKLATILFADVIGSTGLGDQLDPERLRQMLQDYFAAMSTVIEGWSGTVEKYIGDAILAVFGVPVAREDDPVRALHAATEMLATIERLNEGFEARHGVRLAVRIGVNTGEILAPAGARSGGQFLVSGDPVNVASRLQEAAEPGSVLVGERTWTSARGLFEFGDAQELEVKGKREPVLARRLGRRTADEARGVRFQAPMVGRERELGTLLGLLDEAVEAGEPRLVVVSGAAGIGKSRLLREFIGAATDSQPDLVVLRGRCIAAGHGITFWALGEILRAACGISLDEPAESAVDKLRQTVSSLLEPLGLRPNEMDETFFALATSASLPAAANPLDRVEPEGVGEAIARAWPRFLTALATRSPTAIVIEDLHWADDQMVALIESLASRSSGPLMIVGTARPDFLETHTGFASSTEMTVIALRPLSEAQSERLVLELLGDSDPLHALLLEIRQKAEGNPFFLEEILQRLIDEGALVHQAGRWTATTRAQAVRLPDTIHALLAARIDALPAAEKALLQQAAVVGRIFWPGSLASASGGGETQELLRSLERRGMIAARPTSSIEGQPEYLFRHVLIRDVAYASVPKARRALAHAETGRWIEELADDRTDEFAELVAYHYAAAAAGEDADLAWAGRGDEREELRRRAVAALLNAGNAARRRFAVDKAIALHEQALSLAQPPSEKIRANEELGDDHEALFHMDEAVGAYLAAVDLIESATEIDAVGLASLAAKLADAARRWGAFKQPPPHDRIRALVDRSIKLEVGDRLRAELLIGSGLIASSRPRSSSRTPLASEDRAQLPRHIAEVEEGLAIAQRLDDAALLIKAYQVLGLLYWHAGDIEKYREVSEREVMLLDRLPSRRDRVDVLVSIASVRSDAGQYREALKAAEEALELAAELSAHERMHASFQVMWTAQAAGEWDRILEILPWHVTAAAAEPDVSCPSVRGGPPLGGTVLVWRGEAERAAELAPVDETARWRDTMFDRSILARYASLTGRRELASAITDQMAAEPDRPYYPDGLEPFLEALVELGDDDKALRYVDDARRLASTTAMLGPIADRTEAQLLLRQGGDRERAHALVEKALHRFDELAVPFESARTRELLAGLEDEPRRSELLGEALQGYERLGARPFAERVRTSLGRGTEPVAPIA